MRRLMSFLLGVAVGALACYGATQYYLLRADDGFHVVPKTHARLAGTYVDIRSFTAADWSARPQLVADILRAEKQHLLGGAAAKALQDAAGQVLPAWPQPENRHDPSDPELSTGL